MFATLEEVTVTADSEESPESIDAKLEMIANLKSISGPNNTIQATIVSTPVFIGPVAKGLGKGLWWIAKAIWKAATRVGPKAIPAASKIVKGATKINKGVLESFIRHAFAKGRHADLGLPVEQMAVKAYSVINKNLSKLQEGQNVLTSVINGIPNVENGVVRSINMYPGVSNRATTNPIINLGNLTW